MSSRSAAGVERWAFIADWLDPNSGVRWTYQLFAYLVSDAPIELEMVSTVRVQLVAAKPSTACTPAAARAGRRLVQLLSKAVMICAV